MTAPHEDDPYALHHDHRGQRVRVGKFFITAGGTMYLEPEDMDQGSVLVPLVGFTPELPFGELHSIDGRKVLDGIPILQPGRRYDILPIALKDFGGVPECWGELLREKVLPLIKDGRSLLVFCAGGHGRTGTFIASLIALLEPETLDPIDATRRRYCRYAVETASQAEAVFALRGEEVPPQYDRSFIY